MEMMFFDVVVREIKEFKDNYGFSVGVVRWVMVLFFVVKV